MPENTLRRALAGVAAGLVLALAVPLAASAHVTVNPNQAEAGGWTYVTFRVPNESASASTTSLEVHLPTDTPFTSVTYQPTPGWTATVTTAALPQPVEVSGNTITEAPTTIVFEADAGHAVAPGQFQTFTVALGPVPDVGHVVLPATQTYSDGEVVQWQATPEQVAADDTLEPAPVLWVNDAPPADHESAGSPTTGSASAGSASAGSASPEPLSADADPSAGGDSSAGVAVGLSIAAIVIGAAGVLLAAFALGRRRTNP